MGIVVLDNGRLCSRNEKDNLKDIGVIEESLYHNDGHMTFANLYQACSNEIGAIGEEFM